MSDTKNKRKVSGIQSRAQCPKAKAAADNKFALLKLANAEREEIFQRLFSLKEKQGLDVFYEQSTPEERGIYSEELVRGCLLISAEDDPRFSNILHVYCTEDFSNSDMAGVDLFIVLKDYPLWVPVQVKRTFREYKRFKTKNIHAGKNITTVIVKDTMGVNELIEHIYFVIEKRFGTATQKIFSN